MLLFIVLYSPLERRNKNFNTSHVTVYPSPSLSRITGRYFNTSHVTVYLVHVTLYLFWSVNFNTSHVTVYPFRIKISLCCFCISIHLMLLFIALFSHLSQSISIFQYISCYCLSYSSIVVNWLANISIHLMLLFIEKLQVLSDKADEFQYISCYCLSQRPRGRRTWIVEFQYISCYCLSKTDMKLT